MPAELKKYIKKQARIVDKNLDKYLPEKGTLAKAMRYSIFAGGKRFRPILCLATAKAVGGAEKKVLPFACAVEMIHTFTLIHDDLPAMDNSAYRRGKPTCHKVFGEALAVLAGDALNTLAFEVSAEFPAAVKTLAAALLEVVEGQVLDIEAEGKKLSLAKLVAIHNKKTGALLKACVQGSALLCGARPKEVKDLTDYVEHLGLAFQIADDILDATSTKAKLGKPVKADLEKGFPYTVGLAQSKNIAAQEKMKSIEALEGFGTSADILRWLSEYVVKREN